MSAIGKALDTVFRGFFLSPLRISAFKIGKIGTGNMMFQNLHKFNHPRQRGFTLLELVATMGIIAILAAMVLPRYNQFTVQAKISKTKMNLVMLKNGFANYYYQNLLENREMEFPPAPADSQMTITWAGNTVLPTGQTPSDLFSEEQILYNPNNHPYLYYTLSPDSLNNPGFGMKDPDFHFAVKFRP